LDVNKKIIGETYNCKNSMTNCKIEKICSYFPETKLTNEDLEKIFSDWDSEKILNKVGISQRSICSDNETALDMAYKVCKDLFKGKDKSNVDLLIYCTQSPDYYLPTGACILQDKLGLKTSIGAFDYNLGCSGYVYGLAIAKSFISSGIAKSVLLVTSNTYSKHIHKEDKTNRTIFGDAATATLISVTKKQGIKDFVLGTDGKGFQNLIVPNGGLKNRFDPYAEKTTDKNGSIRTENNLYMNGPEIFNFTIEAVPKLMDSILMKNKKSLDEIDYVVFHQANKFILNYLRKKIKIPKEKFYLNMIDTGNTVAGTIPIALEEMQNSKLVKEGDIILLLGFGVGYSYAGVIIEI